MMASDPVQRFYDALGAQDMAAMRACLTPDARLWHCFDGVEQSFDEAVAGWEKLFAMSAACGIDKVVRGEAGGVVVQQHDFWMETRDGRRLAWHVCLVVRLDGDRIARIDEYIDRAGSFPPAAV